MKYSWFDYANIDLALLFHWRTVCDTNYFFSLFQIYTRLFFTFLIEKEVETPLHYIDAHNRFNELMQNNEIKITN